MDMEITLKTMAWTFTVNSLIIFFIISTLISFVSKEKTFRFYSFFIFFITLFILTKTPFESVLIQKYTNSDFFLFNWYLQVLYNLCYLGFISYFLDLDSSDSKLNNLITKSGKGLLVASTLLFIFCLLIQNQNFFVTTFLIVFIPCFFILYFYTLWKVTFLSGKLKYFVLGGSISYIILASYALYLSIYSDNILLFENSADPLIIGLFIEGFIFTLGLGYKVKIMSKQKLLAQKEIILFQNNEKLIKEEHQKHLEKQLLLREIELVKIAEDAEKEKIDEVSASYEGRLALLQIKTLSNQMNPHFIFNALNSIKSYLIVNDQKNAVFYLNQFSKLIRHILESLREDYLTLKEELDIIKIYMNLENMRFGYSIDFQLSVSPEINTEDIRIPTLLLQPFIENALIHGLLPKEGGRTLSIDVYRKNDDVIIMIIDNGIGREASFKNKSGKTIIKKSIGLRIINERINLYNKKHDFLMKYDIEDLKEEAVASGTRVCLTISERSGLN